MTSSTAFNSSENVYCTTASNYFLHERRPHWTHIQVEGASGMTWTLSDNGTTSALTIGTETTLATDTNNGTFVLEVDCSNMAAGDAVEARIYTKTLSGDSEIELWKTTWYGVQVNSHKLSPPVASDQSVKCTLLQRRGTITITSVTGSIPWGTLGTGQTTAATGLIIPAGAQNLAALTSIPLRLPDLRRALRQSPR